MSQALCFNEVQFSPVNRGNQIWIRSTELARALGYSDEKKVSRLYLRNADEFTPDMTQVVEIVDVPEMGTLGNLIPKTRIFSLRGCHLLAMFSRTSVAKEFRKWVLDVLDRMTAQQPYPSLPPAPRPRSTAIDRTSLRALVTAWSKISKRPQGVLWPQICAHFLLDEINDLPVERIPDAITWVQAKIDSLPKALPAVSSKPSYYEQCAAITAKMYELRGSVFRVSSEMAILFRDPFWCGPANQDMPENKREFASAMNHAIQSFFMSVNKDIEAAGLLFTAYVEGEKVLRG